MKQDTLAGELERLSKGAVAQPWTVTHTATRKLMASICGPRGQTVALIGALDPDQANDTAMLMEMMASNLPTILAALRTDGEANSRAVPSGEAVERVKRLAFEGLARVYEETGSTQAAAALRAGEIPPGLAFAFNVARHTAIAALSASKPDDASALLKEAREVIDRMLGWHSAPADCYATGPLTGDPIKDLVSCPSCEAQEFLAKLDASIGRDGA